MKFNPKTHITGKVYDLTQENMQAMLKAIDWYRSGDIHTCHDECPRLPCAQAREIRLLKAEIEALDKALEGEVKHGRVLLNQLAIADLTLRLVAFPEPSDNGIYNADCRRREMLASNALDAMKKIEKLK